MNHRLAGLLICLFSLQLTAQDLCSVVGWATQNGGTTGGGTVAPITVTTLTDLQTQAKSTGNKVIYVSGTLGAGVSTRVAVAANKTIIGLPGAKLIGGFDVKANNVIIRNMIVQGPGAVDVNGVDCITIDKASNVWIDHCTLYDGQDGNMDITNGANYVSITWCKFYYTSASSNHQFCNLIGNSDSKTTDRGKLKVTMMYNWWAEGCKERMPRVRFGQVHVVNNYFNAAGNNHCVRAGIEADLLVEGNYFENVSTPIDLFENNFTAITSRNNTYVNTGGNAAGSGTSFSPAYTLTIAPSGNVKSLVVAGAGATMPSPTQCTGTVTPPVNYTITTSSNPGSAGTITGSGTYASGNTATLSATAAAGYVFSGWSGDTTSNSNPLSFTVIGNRSYTANFTAIPATYTLTSNVLPAGSGVVTGGGSYASGSIVTLTASPANGYSFVGWGGDATGTSASTTITMNSNKTVTANFKAIAANYTVTTAANPVAGGTVSGGGTYPIGTSTVLTASPAAGYVFSGWSGDATGTANPLTITPAGNVSVTANFNVQSSSTSTIRIEDNAGTANGLCLYEGTISSNSGAANGKVINLTNSTGKGANWRVNVPAAGNYTLNWRYVNSSSSNTYSMRYYLNGVMLNSALGFPKTSSSTVFSNTVVVASLRAGNNDIRLESSANNATADIDWLEVTGIAPVAGNCAAARPAASRQEPSGLYPNPANGSTRLVFNNPVAGNVFIQIFSSNEKKAGKAVDYYFPAGMNRQDLNIRQLPAGFYSVVVLLADGSREVYKLLIQ